MAHETSEGIPENIISAAVEIDGTPYLGEGHDEILDASPAGQKETQGFVTNTGRFIDRKEAYLLAEVNGQLVRNTVSEKLKLLHSADFTRWDVLEARRKKD